MEEKISPPEMKALTGLQLLLTINIKPDGSLDVDNAQGPSEITPQTPGPKTKEARRVLTPSTAQPGKILSCIIVNFIFQFYI